VMEVRPPQRTERSEKTGVWGRIPRKHDDLLTGPLDLYGPSDAAGGGIWGISRQEIA
jgi:hypothetical protein